MEQITLTLSLTDDGVIHVRLGDNRELHAEEQHAIGNMIIASYHVNPKAGIWPAMLKSLGMLGEQYFPLEDGPEK